MKRIFLACLAAGILLGPGTAFASETAPQAASDKLPSGVYLFDLFKSPAYRSAWRAMFEGEPSVPSWIDPSGAGFDGVATPSQDIEIGGRPYLLSNGCKPHDCGDNQFYVLYSQETEQSWGLLQVASEPPRFFGDPGETEKRVLLQAE